VQQFHIPNVFVLFVVLGCLIVAWANGQWAYLVPLTNQPTYLKNMIALRYADDDWNFCYLAHIRGAA
jgi:hypothetical protein